MKKYRPLILFSISIYLFLPVYLFAQAKTDTVPTPANISLQQCISFALRNQPATRQANIDEQINDKNIRIALADWLPQITASGNAQHYFQLPVTYFPNLTDPNGPKQLVSTTVRNSSVGTVNADQVIYNSTVALAARTSKYSRQYYKEGTVTSQINVVADVSKAFYDVLLTQKQLLIIEEDIVRLQRNLKDAYNQYQGGIVDKIDYKQATISLNNEISAKKQAQESIKGKIAYLKQIMGFAAEKPLTLAYDSTKLEQEGLIDTNQVLDVTNRIEYQQLQTTRSLQDLNVSYYKWNFLPSISAFGTYNLSFVNDNLSDLYSRSFPNSLVGINLSFPIFQGGKRIQNVRKAKLQVDRANLDIVNSKNTINTEYTQALAAYKSSFTDFQILKKNVDLAKDVYDVVSLQYREGIKTYLNVITAQSDLRTAELNYYNALFTVLSSKIDLQKSLGKLSVQY